MADIKDINKPSTLNNDGEEPIVVAQRFFNIFRQLHIFNAEKKENFNQMVLGLPQEVKNAFGNLPGGGLLQDYVLDLEKNSPSFRAAHIKPQNSPNILESVLAQPQAQVQVQSQAQAQPFQAQLAPQQIIMQAPSGPCTLVADESFTKAITGVLKESHAELAKMFMENQKVQNAIAENTRNAFSAMASANIQSANLQSANMAAFNNSKEQTVSASQSSSSGAGLSSGDISQLAFALKESQIEVAKMIMQHNTMSAASANNANNIQITNTAPAYAPSSDVDFRALFSNQVNNFQEMSRIQTAELSSIISVALKEGQELSTQTIVEAISLFHKENMELLREQMKVTNDNRSNQQNNQFYEDNRVFNKKKPSKAPGIFSQAKDNYPKPEKVFEPIVELKEEELSGWGNEDIKVEETIKEVVAEAIPEIIPELVAEPVVKPKPKKSVIDWSAMIEKKIEEKETSLESDFMFSELDDEPVSNFDFEEFIKEPLAEVPIDEITDNIKPLEAAPVLESESEEFEDLAEDSEADWEWEYEEVDANELETKADASLDTVPTGQEGQDWKWDYEEEAEAVDVAETSEEDWEWEYEEVEEEGTEVDAQPLASSELDQEGQEGQDWEWEYEEEDELDSVEDINKK